MRKIFEIKKKVSEYIRRNNMLDFRDVIVAGVSGGADSMCLLNILIDMREIWDIDIVAVHVHHGIRGISADKDMGFVEEFCEKKGIEFRAYKYDVPGIANEKHLSEEEAGRIVRYEAFEKVRDELLKKYSDRNVRIAVAHNMDDNNETFLFNLFRGSGIKGISGISPVRDSIIRPVLCLSRSEIIDYLTDKGVDYRIDSTNMETDYTRNKIRLKLMPYIRDNINEGVDGNISRTSQLLREISEYMEKQSRIAFQKYVIIKENNCHIHNELWKEDMVIVKMVVRETLAKVAEKLKDITMGHVESVVALGENEVSKSVNLPYGMVAVKTYDGVMVKKVKNKENREIIKEEIIKTKDIKNIGDHIETEHICFTIEKNESIDLTEKTYTKWMNCDILNDSLCVRTRKSGDYMVIDSQGRKKKIKDMMIDCKIPKDHRDEIYLLADGQEILWMIGYRMSDRCKINDSMENVVKVEWR